MMMNLIFGIEKVDYPWYEIIQDSGKEDLQQGDFIFKCPVIFPSFTKKVIIDLKSNKEVDTEITYKIYDLIIVTQSCDLKFKKVNYILLCPIFTLQQAEQKMAVLKSSKEKERIRRGYKPNLHILDKCSLDEFSLDDYWIVNFSRVFTLPIELIKAVLPEKRLRLLPPYRESLAQAFARFIMRVGLPKNIEFFSQKI
jgi:hypothetical protein